MTTDDFRPPVGKPTMGAHAMGIGAVMADCSYFAGYPITPQTELLEYVSQALPEHGGVFQQLGDELSSIMAVFGAAVAGKRAMTATVGPGLNLMVEGLANAAGAEVPLVLGALTRAHVGVSAGLLPAQSDIRMLKGGGNGDYHLPILAPASVTEIVRLTAEAFDLADLYATPVVVAIDGVLANLIETLEPFDVPHRDLPPKTWSLDNPRTDGGRRLVSAYRTPELDTLITYKLQDKYRRMAETEVRYEAEMVDDAEVVVVAYGIMARVTREAVRRVRAKGIRAGLFRPITLFPFPDAQLGEIAAGANEILVTEINFGQVLPDVRLAANGRCPVRFLGQPAMPIPPAAVEHAIEELAAGRSVEQRTFRDVHPTAWWQLESLPEPQRSAMEGIFAMLGGGDDPQRWIDTLLGIRPGTHDAGGETS
jgi:2-oxoglutarate ferredoxin oxidoreductase subunit alpha